MKINIFSIEKLQNDNFLPIIQNYKKLIEKYSKVNEKLLFNKKIVAAQKQNEGIAKKSYSELFEPHLGRYNIFLHPEGKELDSFEFSTVFEKNSEVNFFIAGAYGFEEEFLKKAHLKISLSKLTFGHKIAKVVLFEQIYRSFTILNNHPYHK